MYEQVCSSYVKVRFTFMALCLCWTPTGAHNNVLYIHQPFHAIRLFHKGIAYQNFQSTLIRTYHTNFVGDKNNLISSSCDSIELF